jgi:TolB-like protein
MAPDAASRLASSAKLAALMQAAMGIESSVASVAVLPFVNRSRDPDDEYFSDGLADEILNMLAKIRGLRVAARTSSFQFRDTRDDLATIGRRLNVAALLEGSVRLSGTQVRISVRLLKVADGFNLWSETYDRALDETFAVQDEIAESVVRELRTALLGEEPEKAAGDLKAEVALATRGRSANPEANRLCMHGRYFMERGTREDAVKADRYFKMALEVDPGYALAWAHLGRAHMREADMGWIPPEEGHGQGRPMVERALSLEPDLPEGHAALGWTRMVSDWDWRGADASFHRALELMPGNTVVLSYAGTMASNLGRFDEAIELHRRAVEQDPLSSLHYYALGIAFYRAGRDAEAEEFLRRGIELSPKRVVIHAHLALALLSRGRGDEALAEATKEPEWWARLWALAIIHDASGRPKEADQALRELIESGAETAAYQIAAVHAMRREPDPAFEWLERAFQLRDTGLAELISNPRLRSLHGDPRWAAFLSKMGFDA